MLSIVNIVRVINKGDKNLQSHINRWNRNVKSWQNLLQTIRQKRAKDSRFQEKVLMDELHKFEVDI